MSEDRLSSLDASFLEVESKTAHMHVGWAALFAPPRTGSKPGFEELCDHVASRLSRAPRYRQRLAQVPFEMNDPVWVGDAAFDIRDHVRRAPSPDFRDVIDMVLSSRLERDRPLWELWIADALEDGRIGVVGKAHHCMVDGLAAVELASLLLDPTPEPSRPRPDDWRPDPAPGGLSLLAGALLDRAGQALKLARIPILLAGHPKRVFRIAQEAPRTARAIAHAVEPAPGGTPLNEPISAHRHLARTRRPLGDLTRIKRRFGTTINDVVLAVAAGGVRRFLEQRKQTPLGLKTMVPVSVRGDAGVAPVGNQISFVFVDLPCDEPDPVRRLSNVNLAMSARKRGGEPEGADAVMRALGYAPRTLQHVVSHLAASPRAFNLVVSNIPGPREPLYMCGCELEEAYPVVPIADRHALAIGVTTVKDDSFFGVYADPWSLPDADLLARAIDESIDELLALS
jgi:diacylglycerol O-acyltransferase / wax synthase